MKTIKKIAVALFCIGILTACGKNGGESTMSAKMTDAPGDFEKVNVEVIGFQLHYQDEENEAKSWVSLNTNAGIYDLLELQNNVTALIASNTKIPAGKVNQIRLVLGANNSVQVDGVVFDLKTPSAMQSGLKIKVDAIFKANKDYEILIDFDAAKSIVIEGNDNYSLKPVIQVESLIEI